MERRLSKKSRALVSVLDFRMGVSSAGALVEEPGPAHIVELESVVAELTVAQLTREMPVMPVLAKRTSLHASPQETVTNRLMALDTF